MKRILLLWSFVVIVLCSIDCRGFGQNRDSDVGEPYTRSAFRVATNAIKKYVAFHAGSRYGYVYGKKVRLSQQDLLRGEAIQENGILYLPVTFAPVLSGNYQIDPIPENLTQLSERWVYKIHVSGSELPPSIRKKQIRSEQYFALEDWVSLNHQFVHVDSTGLVLVSNHPIQYTGNNRQLAECITSIFDTPEKYMNPALSIKYIPWLHQQGDWTTHAKATPNQIEELRNGPEKVWNVVSVNDFDFTGFNFKLLGSKVPPPGIYPRLLFSPEDIPMLQKHIRDNASGQKSMVEIAFLLNKSWLNPSSSDGKVFELLEKGDVDKIRSQMEKPIEGAAVYHVPRLTKDHQPVIYNSHITYVTNCLTTMALYALLTDDATLGKRTANAIVTYFKLIEPDVDKFLQTSDSELGATFDGGSYSTTHWRGMHGIVPHMDMPFALDFAGKWMNPEQLKFMQTLIAKSTYGRRTGGGDGPRRAWRDINHVTWHLTHFLALAAIEGLDGFDEEGYLSGAELTRDFLDWGIDRNGQVFESNGKSGGGLQFEFLSMVVLARRGENLFGHPHLRKLMEAQTEITSPNALRTVTSGTWSGNPLSSQFIGELKAFYPSNKFCDYLLTNAYPTFIPQLFDPDSYQKALIHNGTTRMRLTGPTYPDMGVFGFPYIADWKITKREDLALKLDWQSDEYGMFSSSSDKTADATWINLQVRQNHYIGAGHHHSDIGMFHFSAMGINWFTESPFQKEYDSKYHNAVLIDGIGESDQSPAKGKYLGASVMPNGAIASADLTYSYCWKWCTQVKNWGEGFSSLAKGQPYKDFVWELEPDPAIIDIFRGTTNYKMRPWWATSNQANFVPTLRAPWNPVEYAFRSAGLIRGSHSYGVIVDDVKKDTLKHLYQWTAMLGTGVWKTNLNSDYKSSVILGYDRTIQGNDFSKPVTDKPETIKPQPGTPMLFVYLANASGNEKIDVEFMEDGPISNNKPEKYCRLSLNQTSEESNYKIILIPFRYGDQLPVIREKNNTVILQWKDQVDEIKFLPSTDHRTKLSVYRSNNLIVTSL